MQLFGLSALIAATCLTLRAHALPRPVPTVSYSVVNIGGVASSALPTTIYETVTTASDSTKTVTNNIAPTALEVTGTLIIPQVSGFTTSIYTTTIATTLETAITVTDDVSAAYTAPAVTTTDMATTTVTFPVEQTASTSTQYYDDGMWHTSYAVWSPTRASISASSTAASSTRAWVSVAVSLAAVSSTAASSAVISSAAA